jgi:hypothetical protein
MISLSHDGIAAEADFRDVARRLDDAKLAVRAKLLSGPNHDEDPGDCDGV